MLEDERHVIGRAVRYHPVALRRDADPHVTRRGKFAENSSRNFLSARAGLSAAAFVVPDDCHAARRAVGFISGTCGRCSEPLLLRRRLRARRTSEVYGARDNLSLLVIDLVDGPRRGDVVLNERHALRPRCGRCLGIGAHLGREDRPTNRKWSVDLSVEVVNVDVDSLQGPVPDCLGDGHRVDGSSDSAAFFHG